MKEKELPKHVQKIIANLDRHIEEQQALVTQLKGVRKLWLEYKEPEFSLIDQNPKFGRDMVMKFLKMYKQPVQTVQTIDILYKGLNDEQKYNLVKHLSVIYNQWTKAGILISETRKGIKGNFYTLKEQE